MARIFGTSSQSQQQRRLPLGFQVETQKNAEKLFLHGISKTGVFEEEISSLDEKDADTAGRLLCWAAQSNKHPGVRMASDLLVYRYLPLCNPVSYTHLTLPTILLV